MSFLGRIRRRVNARIELTRARMRIRGMVDYDLIGRLCGFMLFPFVIYVCCGSMQNYSNMKIHDALEERRIKTSSQISR
ncbi:hypothetical protein STCU_04045 [Strigomonas culicis]|uniref:Uncharacterized protein n=1 Tax=Strigomonas culicis TaxID=28005 RepID=S9W3P1_9TRYP|nr:hypothetical protein STCU_04045 [Strigomonas culicis]|eukprot:EPY30480.1 hypothetical protein STCU_04045 [Strigomonas culicis]